MLAFHLPTTVDKEPYKDGVLISKELECDYTVIAESNLVAKFSAKNGAENEK